ncbi:hypothetical protein BGX34_009772 [Mortierella sp. NVP85]|nr:hypothetical protein BGX34_009772 [Mortierella sp. NVP85]
MNILSTNADMFEEKASTFGLSDDDLMSSFTTFTAKLGDSLLPRLDPSTGHAPAFGAISETGGQFAHSQVPHDLERITITIALDALDVVGAEPFAPKARLWVTAIVAATRAIPAQHTTNGFESNVLWRPTIILNGHRPANCRAALAAPTSSSTTAVFTASPSVPAAIPAITIGSTLASYHDDHDDGPKLDPKSIQDG